MNLLKKTFLTAAVILTSGVLFAQVRVSVEGMKGNDTLLFRSMNGSAAMKEQVAHDLASCGWFDMIQSGVSTYVIDGTGSGNILTLTVSDGAGNLVARISASGNSLADVSHQAVDAVLKKLYSVQGICRSRITFSVDMGNRTKEICICDYDGRNIRRVSQNRGLSLEPCWTPGGRSVVYSFVASTFTALAEYDLAMQKTRQLARFPGLNAGGAVSPDGRQIAMVLSKDNQVDIYIRNLNGGPLKRLTSDKAVEASPCWSPDGKRICYVSDAGSGRPRLRIIPASGGYSRAVPGALGSESVTPSWSADGKITYSAKLGSYVICVVDPSGQGSANPQQKFGVITKGAGNWESPSWAPDNRHVICMHKNGLWIVDTWTGRARQLVGGRSKCFQPDWSGIIR